MPRKPRFNLIDVPQHVIQRGNNRAPCFFTETDYYRYLDDLKTAANKFDCRIHAYVLMTNHVHLLVTPMAEHAISEMMQSLGRRYVRYINKEYKRTGTLWEGRFKSSLIDSERYLLTCMQYIEMNPVRASMVEHPAEYIWSSYQFNAQDKTSKLLESHPVYAGLGNTTVERKAVYRDLFSQQIDKNIIHDIREALNHELVLGRSYFRVKIEKITQRQTEMGSPGRPRVEEERAMYAAEYFLVY